MKKIVLPVIACSFIAFISACHSESDMQANQRLTDSLFARYPGKVGAIRINPENRENLVVVLGAPAFYGTSAEDKKQQAVEIGVLALGIFGKESYLKTGRLVITRDVNNTADNPADGISTDMKLDSLIKAGFMK